MAELISLIANDDEIIAYIHNLVEQHINSEDGISMGNLQNFVDNTIDSAFSDFCIFELLDRSKKKLINNQSKKHEIFTGSPSNDSIEIPRPQFSPSEPIRVAWQPGRRHKSPPSSKSPKGQDQGSSSSSKGGQTPLSTTSSPGSGSGLDTSNISSAGKPKQTISPDIVSPSRSGQLYSDNHNHTPRTGSSKKSATNKSLLSPSSSSPGSGLRMKNILSSSPASASGASSGSGESSDTDIVFSPESYASPTKSTSSSRNHISMDGRSPGSNLEDDDFDANNAAAWSEEILWRGFTDTEVTKMFKERGGTEYAPMSTSKKADVAVGYAIRKGVKNGALLMRLKTKNSLERGAELTWLSVFPGEAETLYPPLTFMQPTGREQVIEYDGIKLTVVECTTTLP